MKRATVPIDPFDDVLDEEYVAPEPAKKAPPPPPRPRATRQKKARVHLRRVLDLLEWERIHWPDLEWGDEVTILPGSTEISLNGKNDMTSRIPVRDQYLELVVQVARRRRAIDEAIESIGVSLGIISEDKLEDEPEGA